MNKDLKDTENLEAENLSSDKVEDTDINTTCDEKEDNFEKESKELDDMKEAFNKLKEENEKINNELATVKDRLLRTVAEYDNFRKRTSKEKETIYTDACEDVLKEMLPVLDNLERAAMVDGNIDDIKQGIEMTNKQFMNALQKLNVEEISTDNAFDPNFHNAVMHIEDGEHEEKEIVEVFQKGYKRGEKVIRYSMVKVAN